MANFKYCPNCGAYLSDEKGYLVCHKCGKKYEVVLKQLTDEEKEAKYQKALSLMNEHNYRQAEVVLKTIKNYKDVNNLLDECAILAPKEKLYKQIIYCINHKEFVRAHDYLEQLGDYRDIDEKRDYVEKELITIYDSGLNYYKKKRYGLAKKEFNKIKGYKDSTKYYFVCEHKVRTITIIASIIGFVIGFGIGFGIPKLLKTESAVIEDNVPTIEEIFCPDGKEDVVIKAHVVYDDKQYNFTVIDERAFENNTDIKSLTIENGVTEIKDFAFFGCTNLKEVKISDSVVSVSEYAFEGCDITSYEGPAVGLKAIHGSYMERVVITSGTIVSASFHNIYELKYLEIKGDVRIDYGVSCRIVNAKVPGNCIDFLNKFSLTELTISSDYYRVPNLSSYKNLEKIEIEEGITQIDSYAFNNTKIKSIYIPSSVINIGNSLFSNCDELEEIIVSSDNPSYDSRDNCNAIIRKSGNMIIAACKTTVIPDSVVSIGSFAFAGVYSEEILNIPSNITEIGEGAFQNCKAMVEVNIPSSITQISNQTFSGCTKLKKVTMTDSITQILPGAFNNCVSLENITLSENITTIYDNTFCNCEKLKEITLPSKVKAIKEYAFFNCIQLKKVNTTGKITLVNYHAFSNCQRLETFDFHVELYDDSESCLIGEYAFYNCVNLDNIVISGSVRKISPHAFSDCFSLKNLTICEGVKEIQEFAFSGCHSLEVIHFPLSLETIETYAFYGNNNLKELYFDVNLKTINVYAFASCNNIENVYYKGTEAQWNQIEILNGNSELYYGSITYEYNE